MKTSSPTDIDHKGFFDRWQEKLISRRLYAWHWSLVLTILGKLESEHFAYITLIFIGGEILEKYKDVVMNYFKK